VDFTSGGGGNGNGSGENGANAGTISGIKLAGPLDSFGFDSGAGGASGSGTATAGNGGNISDISGSVGVLYINGGAGGASAAGKGGAGATINNASFSPVAEFVRTIAAGNGGSGATEGQGGSINNVKVAGDIGDFVDGIAFNAANVADGQGGLFAGQGGGATAALNGSISDVTANRIASIIAGRPGGTTVGDANDVISISGIKTKVIGVDLNNNGVADDDTGAAWTVGDADFLVDGVVIVKSGGFTGAHPAPLIGGFIQV